MSIKNTEISDVNSFGSRLGSLLPKNKRSEFAEKLGVSYETVRVWIKGTNLPKGPELLKIPDILNVSADWLYFNKKTSKPSSAFANDVDLLKTIHEYGDTDGISAIHQNLEFFVKGLEGIKAVKDAEKVVDDIQTLKSTVKRLESKQQESSKEQAALANSK